MCCQHTAYISGWREISDTILNLQTDLLLACGMLDIDMVCEYHWIVHGRQSGAPGYHSKYLNIGYFFCLFWCVYNLGPRM